MGLRIRSCNWRYVPFPFFFDTILFAYVFCITDLPELIREPNDKKRKSEKKERKKKEKES